MAVTHIPNEEALKTVLIGTELIPGTAVVPTARLLGQFSATPGRGAIRRSAESTGGYDRTVATRRAQGEPSGSYAEDLTYESYPTVMRYGVKGGGAGVSDANAVPGYTYAKSPSFAVDDIDTFSAQFGVEGLGWQATGVRWNEFTVTADSTDADDNWKFSATPFMREVVRLPGWADGVATGGSATTVVMTGAGWTVNQWAGAYVYQDYGSHIGEVRQVLSNTADTLTLAAPPLSSAAAAGDRFHIAGLFPVVPDADYETITLEGTRLFLDRYDPVTSSIGTTDVSERLLSFNVTQQLNLARKRRFPGIVGRTGRGAREISGTVRFEFDRWDEYRDWEEDTELSIRIEKEGSVIDPATGTRKLARIDVERAVWDAFTGDTDNNNMTMSLSFVGKVPASEPISTFTGVNRLPVLP